MDFDLLLLLSDCINIKVSERKKNWKIIKLKFILMGVDYELRIATDLHISLFLYDQMKINKIIDK